MPRKLGVEYPGAIYHVMNHRDRREQIFRDNEDRELFLGTLRECCGKMRPWTRLSKLLPRLRRKGSELMKSKL